MSNCNCIIKSKGLIFIGFSLGAIIGSNLTYFFIGRRCYDKIQQLLNEILRLNTKISNLRMLDITDRNPIDTGIRNNNKVLSSINNIPVIINNSLIEKNISGSNNKNNNSHIKTALYNNDGDLVDIFSISSTNCEKKNYYYYDEYSLNKDNSSSGRFRKDFVGRKNYCDSLNDNAGQCFLEVEKKNGGLIRESKFTGKYASDESNGFNSSDRFGRGSNYYLNEECDNKKISSINNDDLENVVRNGEIKMDALTCATNCEDVNDNDDDENFYEAYDGPLPWLSEISSSTLENHWVNPEDEDYCKSNSLKEYFLTIDKLFEGGSVDQQRAFDILNTDYISLSKNPDFLWRLAKGTYLLSQVEKNRVDNEKKDASLRNAEQKRLIYRAKELASGALELDELNPNIHKWFAITLGSTNDYESINVKIQNGYKFKEHIEKAIELNRSDPTSHYLLGRWAFGVYSLSWVERKVAATLFSSPPTSTVEEALQNFLEADRLNPKKWKEVMLFIAKCYIEKQDYKEALKWLHEASALPNKTNDDSNNQLDIDSLITKYKKFNV